MNILIIILISFIYPSIDQLTNWECSSGTYHPSYYNTNQTQSRSLDKAVVRAKIWEIHREDGLFEMPENAIEEGFQKLVDAYKQYGILVSLYDTEIIYSDSLYYFTENSRPFELMQNHSENKFMNFFYLPNIDYTGGDFTGYGQAFNTPGNEFFVAGNECKYVAGNLECYDLASTFIPIHELGHCFGLLHTHRSIGEEHVIREGENDESCEVNCYDTGDFLCDTEATNSIRDDVLFDGLDCSYDLVENDECGYTYTPQIDNFMSYTHFECAYAFTQEQIDIIYDNIQNDIVVSKTVVFLGDLNDDLTLNVLDAVALVDIIMSTQEISDFNLWIGDLNNDLEINVLDIVELINLILS